MRLLSLTLCLALASGTALAQKVYKVVQPDGTILFTDSPPPGEDAEQVDVQPINTTPPLASPTDAFDDGTVEQAGGTVYSQVRITSPANDSSFWSTSGDVDVDVALEPKLRPGDKVDILLNGQRVGGGKTTAVTLSNMDRGTYSVQAVVKDGAGKVLGRSDTVTFTLQKGSALSPQRRPRAVPF